MKYLLGVDVGSVSTNMVILDEKYNVVKKLYLDTSGKPIDTIQKGLAMLKEDFRNEDILAVGTTGSGRILASKLIGADIAKNEITTHAVAALASNPNVKTVLEIGGQDSKIIIIRNGIVIDFAMNTVCAAGTGSFLDRQAQRLGIPIDQFGKIALTSKKPTRIAGRCAVFAESDMIHKQQIGHNEQDIIWGLCLALVRNFLSNVAKGKNIESPIFFQGGVAANLGIKKAFEDQLNCKVYVPKNFDVMGSIGAAILASNEVKHKKINKTSFLGFNTANRNYDIQSFECDGCSNICEIIEMYADNVLQARWGDKCGKWSSTLAV